MKTKTRYVVMALKEERGLMMMGRPVSLSLKWANRMCGVIPVFETKKAATEYAGKKYEVMPIEIEVKT